MGKLNVFDVCPKELEFMLGIEGYEELVNLFKISSLINGSVSSELLKHF